jgi:hypothetical protein
LSQLYAETGCRESGIGIFRGWGISRSFNPNPNPNPFPFPFPAPTDEQRNAIAAAAKELDRLRNNRLNPPEWTRTEVLEFPGTADGPWRRYIDPQSVPDAASVRDTSASPIGTVRYASTTDTANRFPTAAA